VSGTAAPSATGPLAARTALVTGASRGIGAATARALAAAGARVALLARTAAALDALDAELGGASGALSIVCDLGDADAVDAAVARVVEAFGGPPDVLVNNAGAFAVAPAHETSIDTFTALVDANLVAPFRLVRAFLPAMRERGAGHIVTVGSVADRATFPGNAAYASTKYGLRALHEVLRLEQRGTGVRATLVSPGPVDTPLWDPLDPDTRDGFTPRAAMLRAEDVAEAILYAATCPPSVNVDELRLSRA
jgi:NADP-dependent 3-hydroxy acid dehydrogenase YdfG